MYWYHIQLLESKCQTVSGGLDFRKCTSKRIQRHDYPLSAFQSFSVFTIVTRVLINTSAVIAKYSRNLTTCKLHFVW